MADGCHFENRYISISQLRIFQIWRNLVCICKFWPMWWNVTKIQKFPNSRWRTDAILKLFLGYNSAPYARLRWNLEWGGRVAHIHHTKVWWWKCLISKIQHGGRPPFRKSLYLSISATNRPNLTKFDMQTQILTQARKHDKNSEIPKFKMADGRHIENRFLAITQLYIVSLRWNLERGGRITHIRRSVDQNA